MKRAKAKSGAAAKKSAPAKDIDEYLAALPKAPRAALEKLRKTIKAAAHGATEVISYRIPMFKLAGPLVGFAAFDDHCTFFLLGTSVMDAHKSELESYPTGKGSIRFTVDEPLPDALVKKLVKARIDENEAAARCKGRA